MHEKLFAIYVQMCYCIIEVMRMSTVNITLRMDADIKHSAEKLFADLGMNMTTAFNMFVRQALREQGLPFSVTRKVPNAVTLAAMDAAENDEVEGPFNSVSELMEALNA